jgi:hypothetical protein
MSISRHGCLDRLGILHVKLFQHIFGILGLTNKGSFLELLDLKAKKECQLSHHGHLESLRHDPTKILAPRLISRTKYNVIDIYLAHKNFFVNFASEKSRIGFAYLKAFP